MGDRIQLELVLFRTLVNIQGGFFRRNCFRLKAINFFCKELLLKCLTGSIRPYDEWWWFKRHAMPIWHDNVDATLISQRQTHYMFTTPVLWRCVSVAKNIWNINYCWTTPIVWHQLHSVGSKLEIKTSHVSLM